MSEEKSGSKADTLVKVVLVFFISLLSFSVGTFVGKQVSDSDHRNLALEGVYNKHDVASTEADEKEDGDGKELASEDRISEKDVEHLTEEFVNKEKNREPASESKAEGKEAKAEGKEEAKGETHETTSASTAKEKEEDDGKTEAAHSEAKHEEGYKTYAHGKGAKVAGAEAEKSEKQEAKDSEKGRAKAETHVAAEEKENKALHKVAQKVAEGKAPSDGRREERKPQSVLPSVAGSAVGKYGVQVASYLEEKDAKEYVSTLKEKGYQSFYLSANVNGRTWFRVLVGLFDDVKNAQKYRTQIAKDLGTEAPLVQKIVQ